MSYYWEDNSSSTGSTVSGARNITTSMITISARPQVTYVRPWYDTYPRIVAGFDADLVVEGYMLKNVTNVYISAGQDVYDHTSALSAVSAFSPFSGTSPLTGKNLLSLYPAFSGFELASSSWRVESENTMSISLLSAVNPGNIDLILLNIAGYCILSKALSGSTINVNA